MVRKDEPKEPREVNGVLREFDDLWLGSCYADRGSRESEHVGHDARRCLKRTSGDLERDAVSGLKDDVSLWVVEDGGEEVDSNTVGRRFVVGRRGGTSVNRHCCGKKKKGRERGREGVGGRKGSEIQKTPLLPTAFDFLEENTISATQSFASTHQVLSHQLC